MVLNPYDVSDQVTREEGPLHIGPSSIDLHVAGEKTILNSKQEYVNDPPNSVNRIQLNADVNVANEDTYPTEEMVKCDPIRVEPGEFCLARSQEKLDLEYNIEAEVSGRSSVGRLGLFVENAGLVDRGFNGTITLELFNPTERAIEIPAGTRIAQLVFSRQQGSRKTAYDGKYNGQVEPTASRLHEDGDL